MGGVPQLRRRRRTLSNAVMQSPACLPASTAAPSLPCAAAHPDVQAKPRVPVLLYANKHDLPSALDASDVCSQLRLEALLRDRPWHIASSNALTGDGVDEGVTWLVGQLSARK